MSRDSDPREHGNPISEAAPDSEDLRHRAESIAGTAKEPPVDPLWPAEAQRVVHELHVHQIELEIQNEELRATRERLEESRERYFDLYDLAPVGYITLSEKGLIQGANLTVAAALGVDRSALLGQPFSAFVLHEDQDIYYLHFKALYNTGQRQNCELRLQNGEGGTFWARLQSVLATDQSLSRMVITDISHLKHSEEIAKTQASRLAEQAALLDLAQDAIFVVGMDSRIIYWNKGAEKMYGWSAEEAAGRDVHQLLRTESATPLNEIRDGLVQNGQWFGELKHYTRNGDGLNVLTSWVLRRENGEPAGWLEIARDVTEMRSLEEHLRETQKLESLGVLAGGVAHDFNNLLTGIMGNVSLAIELRRSGSDISDILENALHASEKAAYLTRQMLAYVGKGQFLVQSVDLASPVREAFRLVSGSIPDPVAVEFDFHPDVCCIHADPTQLQQIAMNLILNAVEAVGERGGKVVVRLSTCDIGPAEDGRRCAVGQLARGHYGVLEVQDTGPGIDPSVLPKIFDPFFTTKFTGRGLGLASTAGIVRLLHGAITVESEPGHGATFQVYLPMESAVEETATGQAAKVPILVVDDEKVVRQTASAMLRTSGYDVALAENGRQAVDLFQQRNGRFALVLLDLTMPIMGGPQTIRELKAIRPEVPVIVSTGLTEETAMHRFAGADIAGFIQKPYTLHTLVEKVHSILGPR